MARILVTGGAGYIGSHCAKALALAGHHPITYDNLVQGHIEAVRWGPLVQGDIRDGPRLNATFQSFKPEVVVHLAALASVGESTARPELYYDSNINGTLSLLNAMRSHGVQRIVFSSSCAIYGRPEFTPISETADKNPISPYGYSKMVCEQMMDDFDSAHGLRSVRLRYFNAAGADPEGEIGEDHEPETHLIPLVLAVARGRRNSIDVYGSDYPTPDGTAIRDYIHVTDLAAAHVSACDYLLSGGKSGAFNIGTGKGVSVLEIVDSARLITGRAIGLRNAPRRAGDPAILTAALGSASATLGLALKRSDLRTVLQDAWNWHLKRRDPGAVESPNAAASI